MPPSMDNFLDDSMLDLFRMEVENHSKALETGLVGVEQDASKERLEPLMRAAHSIKGAARIVGLPIAVGLAHAMEDLLSDALKGKLVLRSVAIDRLLQGNDLFRELGGQSSSGLQEWLNQHQTGIEVLQKSLEEIRTMPLVESVGVPSQGTSAVPAVTVAPAPAAPVTAAPAVAAPQTPGVTGKTVAEEKRLEPRAEDQAVRVLSANLNRIMGLTGECLVHARSAAPMASLLHHARRGLTALEKQLDDGIPQILLKSSGEEAQRSLREATAALSRTHSELRMRIDEVESFNLRLDRLIAQLYDAVVASRMQPFSEGLHGYPRMVRDLARELGKQVVLEFRGESTPVDRDVLEKLNAPLGHLVRNSIDHGIESPNERLAGGKPAEGRLIMEARHVFGMLHVSVRDDGRGIDSEALRLKVVEKGYLNADTAADLQHAELMEFLFLPGFSTAKTVSGISGRGVGLDVVASMVREFGGLVRVDSKPGEGTTFLLQLPLTLSVISALLFTIGGEKYALPLSRIDQVLMLTQKEIQIAQDRQFCTVEGKQVGLIDARQVLGLPGGDQPMETVSIVIISDRLNQYGLVVEQLMHQQDLVVIPLDARLGKVPDVSAGAILEDGTPILILDTEDLVRSIDNLLSEGRMSKIRTGRIRARSRAKHILVVDDSLTVRQVERKLLESRGYQVTVAVDGVDGWNNLQSGQFDMMVTDVDMPRMNGIELVRQVKASAAWHALPILIVSYKDREEDRMAGLEAGANYYLTKSSFHDERLLGAVRELIGDPWPDTKVE